jgi:hypothetical protein
MTSPSPTDCAGEKALGGDSSSRSEQTLTGGALFPAAFTVHWASGPTPCCVKHARALINLGAMLGTRVPATAAAEGAQCENCINEAKAGAKQ